MGGGAYDYLWSKIEELSEILENYKQDEYQEIRKIVAQILKWLSDIVYEMEKIDSGDHGEDYWETIVFELKKFGQRVRDLTKRL